MTYNVDYTDCKLLIRNEATGESIAQTKILEYNKGRYSILIDATNFADKLTQIRLTLLIFTRNSIHVFGGIARRSYSPHHLEISMYQGKEHDDRAAKRFTANIDAVISNVTSHEGNEISNHTFNVLVLDLSTRGVRIQTDCDVLEPRARFTLRLSIADQPTCIQCAVVRCLENTENKHKLYGCKFISIENE